ncbi:methyltetrahydrofolate cobalamin methyltransferase [Natranaerofaba carboxydovora]|uniref:methyltetrahydrofolate cobalamin methyltransferase n=1 Tax=Natranaerofaba carboxydovora TaxID=2742683 RepID=UPI001F146FE6|nr:methyltetrahydrofolate cobalamin methyltransferase [Natranaerofaba carboxydovora]UMZ73615.1 5-methyltetrahydrofolate:corrinoid/iron-sulfur protein co-methyltransferase [Natranaerofaba carboxydovora]
MLIVGEKINTSRKSIKEAVENKDDEFIKKVTKDQKEAGAHYIDVNCGTFINNEPELMQWLVETVQEEVDLPLCIDSPNPEAVKAGLEAHKNGQPMLNSISGEKERYDGLTPLVKEYNCKVVVLCMDDDGIPQGAAKRFEVAQKVINDLKAEGVKEDDIYVDPLIQPISTDTNNGMSVFETIERVHSEFNDVHTICGLSNVSYGLPKRKILNQTFMILCMKSGLDSVILDPTDKEMMARIVSTRALMGNDNFCSSYLKSYRKGILGD